MSGDGWRAFQLVPDDVLFFRDGKPSSLGEDHYLRSLFPPLPSTLYGALRTRLLLDAGVSLKDLDEEAWGKLDGKLRKEVGEWGKFGDLKVRGPWLVRDREALFPAPLDLGLIYEKSGPDAKRGEEEGPPRIAHVLRYLLRTGDAKAWSHPLRLTVPCDRTGSGWSPWEVPPKGEDPIAPSDWFLKAAGWELWTRGEVPEPGHFVHARELWKDEQRTGVGLVEKQRLSKEGALYTFGFIRLERGVAIGFEARDTEIKAGGGVRLGGEGRMAALEAGPSLALPAPSAGKRFRLCFVTPALSGSGAYPPGFAAGSTEGKLNDQPCTLVAAFTRGGATIGGWDIAQGKSKPLRRAIPAGSVYVFESGEAGMAAGLHGACLNDFQEEGENFTCQGLGLALAATDDQEI
jgi:CRISPR-associated protein Cmr3